MHDLTEARKNARTDEDAAAIAWAQDRLQALEKMLRECDEELCKLWQRLDDESNRVGDLQERVGVLFPPEKVSI